MAADAQAVVRVAVEPRETGVVARVTIDNPANAYATDEPSRLMRAFLDRRRP